LLEVGDLHFSHGRGQKEVLAGVSLLAREGEITTVLGPNGCGKTTLFKCIGGIWKPGQGEVRLEGVDILLRSHMERARLLATVPQEHEAPFPYSVFEVVLMGRASRVGALSAPSRQDRHRAEEALEEAGIESLREKACTKLSGGEKQLVLIARAIAQDAPVMLLDEPVSHLDFRHQLLILRKIRRLAREKQLIVLMTLHDPNLAMLFSDRVGLMNGGVVVSEGKPQAVITEDSLKQVYGIDVRVISWNGFRIVYPEGGA
jgi:iron complex transport system ATP-binding protein